MNWLLLLFRCDAKPEPYVERVLLEMHDGGHKLAAVERYSRWAYASPYLPETRTLLMPGGKAKGPSYVMGWRPACQSMEALYIGEDWPEPSKEPA